MTKYHFYSVVGKIHKGEVTMSLPPGGRWHFRQKMTEGACEHRKQCLYQKRMRAQFEHSKGSIFIEKTTSSPAGSLSRPYGRQLPPGGSPCSARSFCSPKKCVWAICHLMLLMQDFSSA